VALLLGSAVRAEADGSAPRAAIVVTDRVNVSSGEERLLVVAMARGIEADTTVTFLSPEEVMAKLTDGVAADCLNSTSCVRGLITALEVDDILAVALVRVGTSYQVDATFVDVSDGGLSPRPTVQVDADAGDHAGVFRRHALEYLPHRARPKTVDLGNEGGIEGQLAPDGSVAKAQKRGRHFTTGVWISAGVGAAALATSVVLGLSARSQEDDCRHRLIDDFCTTSEVDSIDRRALLGDIALGAAVGAGVVAGVLYWLSADDEIMVAPTAGSGAPGLTVVGRF